MLKFIMTATLALVMSLNLAAAQDTINIAIRKADGTNVPFKVEVAADLASQEKGLMYREKLAKGKGMIFVYERPTRRAFWMKNTLIPLDMLFFNKAGDIVFIYRKAEPLSLAPVGPASNDVCTVLEIAGGESDRLGIDIGDKLILKNPTCVN